MTSELHKLKIDKSHKVAGRERRVWPWIAVLLLLAGMGTWVWTYQKDAAVPVVQIVRVKATEGAVSGGASSELVALNVTGYVMAAHKVELASKVIGRVAWVAVEMGDKVKKDQVLVRLEDDEYKARVMQEKGQLDSAAARLRELEAGNRVQEVASSLARYEQSQVEADNAQRAYQRIFSMKANYKTSELDDAETLMKSRAAQAEYAKQQYEMMKAGPREEQIAAQKATVSQLAGALALAQVDLDNTVIKAPQDSTVLERNVEVGEFVTNGFVGDRGAKGYVVSIADLNDLLVELDISQNDFAKVTHDQNCWITTDAYPDHKYAGVVERISPVANRQKATVLVRVKVVNPDDLLKPDMNATVAFLSAKKQGASAAGTDGAGGAEGGKGAGTAEFRVPASAVRNGTVFLVENNKVVKRPVVVGLKTASGDVEIKKGLIGGEDLIASPAEELKDGDAVKIQE